MLYSINEIFYSIQGEGYRAGTPTVFIRLAGCNLNCPWCDTNHSYKLTMNEKKIVNMVNKLCSNVSLVVLTGGEPTIYNLEPLVLELEKETSAFIAIETNGTNPFLIDYLKGKGLLDWVTLSPKPQQPPNRVMLNLADEIKIVLDGVVLPEVYEEQIEDKLAAGVAFIQPCSEKYQLAIDFVLAHPRWRLSVQTQKIIGVR